MSDDETGGVPSWALDDFDEDDMRPNDTPGPPEHHKEISNCLTKTSLTIAK